MVAAAEGKPAMMDAWEEKDQRIEVVEGDAIGLRLRAKVSSCDGTLRKPMSAQCTCPVVPMAYAPCTDAHAMLAICELPISPLTMHLHPCN